MRPPMGREEPGTGGVGGGGRGGGGEGVGGIIRRAALTALPAFKRPPETVVMWGFLSTVDIKTSLIIAGVKLKLFFFPIALMSTAAAEVIGQAILVPDLKL